VLLFIAICPAVQRVRPTSAFSDWRRFDCFLYQQWPWEYVRTTDPPFHHSTFHYLCLRNNDSNVSYSSVCAPGEKPASIRPSGAELLCRALKIGLLAWPADKAGLLSVVAILQASFVDKSAVVCRMRGVRFKHGRRICLTGGVRN
jgi:hypothetical protein